MAEAHPVGFRWVMKAKERGARIIHVDPRYSRTSQLADQHVPIRAGTDIAFLGGLIRHVLETESYFRDYVVNYTNAPTIINERFRTPRTSAGVFSGFDPETGMYDRSTWMYEGGEMPSAAGRARALGPGVRGQRRAPACSSARCRATTRSSTRAACSRSCAGTSAATRPRRSSASAASRRTTSTRWPKR